MKSVIVSTHSHPKVAAFNRLIYRSKGGVSTHSHPKVAAKLLFANCLIYKVSTHSHPKVAATFKQSTLDCSLLFQHTATRRWLPQLLHV